MSKKDRLAAVDDKLREREGGEYDLANCIVDHCWSPHPAHLRCATLPLQGRVNTIVLAMRFSASELWQATVTPLSGASPPGIAVRRTAFFERRCRWSMLTRSLQTLGGKRRASLAAAWIAGSSPGNDERRTDGRTKEEIGSRTPTDAMVVFCRALRARPRPSTERRTSIGVPPRFSPRGRVVVLGSASGQVSWDVAEGSPSFERVLPAPACP